MLFKKEVINYTTTGKTNLSIVEELVMVKRLENERKWITFVDDKDNKVGFKFFMQ